MSPRDEAPAGLTRERLVLEALALVREGGLEALSMRSLAERLDVKAASLYWHVRDRRELLELLGESILEQARPVQRAAWRQTVTDTAAALRTAVAAQRDAARILGEAPDALPRSDLFAAISAALEKAGLTAAEAHDLARLLALDAVGSPAPADAPSVPAGSPASIAIDSGSRGVLLRAGSAMEDLIRTPRERSAAAPAIVRGERVVVRRLRGVGYGEIELNPRHPWTFRVQGPTWNTVIDALRLDVRAIKLDGGAARVECTLPPPRGVVPIEVSGGVAGVTLHRPRGVAVAADVSTGAVRVRLDEHSIKAAVIDSQWASEEGASRAVDRYQLRISGGAVQVTLDAEAPLVDVPDVDEPRPSVERGERATAIDIVLDGVEARVASRKTP